MHGPIFQLKQLLPMSLLGPIAFIAHAADALRWAHFKIVTVAAHSLAWAHFTMKTVAADVLAWAHYVHRMRCRCTQMGPF